MTEERLRESEKTIKSCAEHFGKTWLSTEALELIAEIRRLQHEVVGLKEDNELTLERFAAIKWL